MTDAPNDMFPGPKSRPDHPDFWKLSSVVLGLDGGIDPETMTQEQMDEAFAQRLEAIGVDRDSVVYMATQRAFRALGVSPIELMLNPDKIGEVARHAGLWLDAFAAGAMYERGLK